MARTGVAINKRTSLLEGDPARTVHLIGDVHFGSGFTHRPPKAAADMTKAQPKRTTPVCRVMLGDLTNNGLTSEDALALAWIATLGAAPVYPVLGNHDVFTDIRTATQAAAALGMPAKNYTVNLGFAILACLFPGENYTADNSGSFMGADTLAWLDGVLTAATKPVIVANHFSLYNTVLGDGATQYPSTQNGFYVATAGRSVDSNDILALLAAHPGKVKVWAAAHSHSNIDTPGMVSTLSVGGSNVIALNASALVSVDRAGLYHSPINSLYMTYLDDHLELRWRGHGAGAWRSASGQPRVQSVAL